MKNFLPVVEDLGTVKSQQLLVILSLSFILNFLLFVPYYFFNSLTVFLHQISKNCWYIGSILPNFKVSATKKIFKLRSGLTQKEGGGEFFFQILEGLTKPVNLIFL